MNKKTVLRLCFLVGCTLLNRTVLFKLLNHSEFKHLKADASTPPEEIVLVEALNFESLPPVIRGGQFNATGELVELLNWDPSVVWQAGQNMTDFMPMGYFDHSLGIGQLSLEDVAALSLNMPSLNTLADVDFVSKQTLLSLLESLPQLQNYQVGTLPIFEEALNNIRYFPAKDSLKTVLKNHRDSLNVPLGDVVNLESYSLDALPGLAQTPLQQFSGWQEAVLADVPGLSTIAFGAFPKPLVTGTVQLAFADVVFNQHQNQLTRSIVGSYKEGFNVPCLQDCPHVEFSQPEWLRGGQWISGHTLEVRGGEGVLGHVNGGMEPAGRHPFGPGFKVVLWDVDEAAARGDMAIFFNLCIKKTFVDLGCTPYIFGPIPWFPIQEETWGVI